MKCLPFDHDDCFEQPRDSEEEGLHRFFIFVFRRKKAENESGGFQRYMERSLSSEFIFNANIENKIPRKTVFRGCFNEKRTDP
jgi:hypothetical protein